MRLGPIGHAQLVPVTGELSASVSLQVNRVYISRAMDPQIGYHHETTSIEKKPVHVL